MTKLIERLSEVYFSTWFENFQDYPNNTQLHTACMESVLEEFRTSPEKYLKGSGHLFEVLQEVSEDIELPKEHSAQVARRAAFEKS